MKFSLKNQYELKGKQIHFHNKNHKRISWKGLKNKKSCNNINRKTGKGSEQKNSHQNYKWPISKSIQNVFVLTIIPQITNLIYNQISFFTYLSVNSFKNLKSVLVKHIDWYFHAVVKENIGITLPKASLEDVYMPDIIIRVLEFQSQETTKYDEKDLYRYLFYLYLKEIRFKWPTGREGGLNQFWHIHDKLQCSC